MYIFLFKKKKYEGMGYGFDILIEKWLCIIIIIIIYSLLVYKISSQRLPPINKKLTNYLICVI